MKLDYSFYQQDALVVAKELLGKYIVRNINNHTLISKIIETEAYKSNDKACHAYNYKKTKRTAPMFEPGGIAYVYFTYGLYHCFNVVTDVKGEPSAVLIRGVEPINDIEYMSILRYQKPYNTLTKYQLKNFTNGPSKFCMANKIDLSLNKESLLGDTIYITDGEKISSFNKSKRIGIDYSEEAKDYLWRFYI